MDVSGGDAGRRDEWSLSNLASLERRFSTPQSIALERTNALGNSTGNTTGAYDVENDVENAGVAALFVPLLREAFDLWIESVRKRGRDAVRKHSEHQLTPVPIGRETPEEKKDDIQPFPGHANRHEQAAKHFQLIDGVSETDTLRCILRIHLTISRFDPTLSEELGREGSHSILSRLIRLDIQTAVQNWNIDISEVDGDTFMALQDVACEIGSLCSGSFPLKYGPFTVDELTERLPLAFALKPACATSANLDDSNLHTERIDRVILINQVTARQSAQDDVGFVMWPSAVVLSRWLVTNQQVVRDKTILELGAGCGLVGLVAAGILQGQRRGEGKLQLPMVLLTDFNEVVLHNIDRNIALNGLGEVASTAKFDFYQQKGDKQCGSWVDGATGETHKPVDIILAADVICKPQDAVAVANSIHDALKAGGQAVVVCANARHRFGVDRFPVECERVGLAVRVSNAAEHYDGGLLRGERGETGLEQTSGYVRGMDLTLFHVQKAQA